MVRQLLEELREVSQANSPLADLAMRVREGRKGTMTNNYTINALADLPDLRARGRALGPSSRP